MSHDIDGTVDPAFAAVRDAFAANFAAGRELGAALAISVGGRRVVDLWGGHRTIDRAAPWTEDTLVCSFSCTKGLAAVAVMWAVERGMLDLDAPVASYWPEFATGGKATIPVRWLLTHEAGLAAVDRPLPHGSLGDWNLMTSALAEQEPNWEPGSGHGYHGVTFGHLVGEVLRRATGRMCGDILAREIAAPLGVDLAMPLAPADDARTADLDIEMGETTFFDVWGRDSLGPRAFGNPPDCNDVAHCQTSAFRRAEIPAANCHTNARGLERVYRVLASGGRDADLVLASPSLVDTFGARAVAGTDLVMELPTAFSLGFEHTIPEWPFGPGERTYGHNGSGGSLGFVDPDAGVAFGYVMNRLYWGPTRSDPRWAAIFDALYGAL